MEPLDADELLSSVVSRFQWRADESARPLTHDSASGVPLHGDRLRLEQALGNLVDNALRHGNGSVSLRASSVDGAVELHVEDEGGGFPPAFLGHAFERFSRPQPGREGSGAGLGLSIVRVIAEAHGGVAEAANGPAGGADVWLVLPSGTSYLS